jgi:hypothetical protein
MISASQIREQIADFLTNRSDINSFEDWIVRYTWDVHQSGSVAAEQLAYAVEEALSEYSSKQISAIDLRDELLELLYTENRHAAYSEGLARFSLSPQRPSLPPLYAHAQWLAVS